MKKNKLLLPAALVLAMTAANAQQPSNGDCDLLNDPSVSAELKQAVKEQADLVEAERLLNQQRTGQVAESMKTQPPDIKQQSCYDKYSKYKILLGIGFPTIDQILEKMMDALKNQACQIADSQINNTVGKVNNTVNGAINNGVNGITGGKIGNVGNINLGVGDGSVQGSRVNTGTSAIQIGTQGQDIGGNIAGSVGNTVGGRVSKAANGIFR